MGCLPFDYNEDNDFINVQEPNESFLLINDANQETKTKARAMPKQ